MRRRIHEVSHRKPAGFVEEDTCVIYEEEDTCVIYEEEDTCVI
jgi:hypothetical protein